jgi:tetratricopeptide (TPR) repeat protein
LIAPGAASCSNIRAHSEGPADLLQEGQPIDAKPASLFRRYRQWISAGAGVLLLAGIAFLFWSQKKSQEYDEAFKKGLVSWKQRQGERALVEWRKAAQADPRDPELWVMIGRAELLSGRVERALEAWEEALRRGPEYKPALFERGKEGLGRHVARRLPPPVDRGTGWLPLDLEPFGRLEGGTEELQRIQADLRAGAGHSPEYTRFVRGAIHFLEGRYRDAQPLFQSYTDLNGWDATALALLGIAGHYGALPKRAEQALTDALALRHEKLWLKIRAETRYLQGHDEAARADYREAGLEKEAEPLFRRRIPFKGLILWLRADAGLDTAGGSITRWADQSEGRNDATLKELGIGPRVTPSAIQGRPAVLFTGANDEMRLPEGFGDFTAGLSVFVVGETPTAPGDQGSFIDLATAGTGTSGLKVLLGRRRDSERVVYSVEDLEFQRTPFVDGLAPAKGFEGISAVQEPSKAVRLFKRGQPLATGELLLPRKTVRTINRIGAGLKGHLAEILLYQRSLSELERLGVETYLNTKYFPDGGAVPTSEK